MWWPRLSIIALSLIFTTHVPLSASVTAVSSHRQLGPTLSLDQYTVGWISALPIECAAASALLDEEHQPLSADPRDPPATIYTLGRVAGHAVVIGCLPAGRIGTTSAATVASRMLAKFPSIRFGLMVGIGGGVPTSSTDIRLGDVVVSQPRGIYGGVVQYTMGKQTADGLERTGYLNAPPTILLHALSKVQAEHYQGRSRHAEYLNILEQLPHFNRTNAGPDLLYQSLDDQILVQRPPREAGDQVQIHYGTIASDNQVIKNARVRDDINRQLGGDILCFEMEAAGLMNDLPALVIRGISDYSDSHKQKNWQAYAAASAAAYAKEVLSAIPVEKAKQLPPIKVPFLVPFRRNKKFIGRSSVLDELHGFLVDEEWCSYVAMYGLGGAGKSAIAIEFAYQVRHRHPQRMVFWVPAMSRDRLQAAYHEIAVHLKLIDLDDFKTDVIPLVNSKLGHFGNTESWLMIVDGADDLDIFRTEQGNSAYGLDSIWSLLPQNGPGMVLLTTRSFQIAHTLARDDLIPIDAMHSDEAKTLLEALLRSPELYRDEHALHHLLRHLTNLPLAIVQAAAYMVRNNADVSKYIGLYGEVARSEIEVLSEGFDDYGRYDAPNNPIAVTWFVSFRKILKVDPMAAGYLAFMACIRPNEIPLDDVFREWSPRKHIEAIGTLESYSFITKEPTSASYGMHRLVHLATMNWLVRDGVWESWIGYVIEHLMERIPENNKPPLDDWETCLLYVPHALHVISHAKAANNISVDTLLARVGDCQKALGDYTRAEQSWSDVVQLRRLRFGPLDSRTLEGTRRLAETMLYGSRLDDADRLIRDTLAMMQPASEETKHWVSLFTLDNARVLEARGSHAEADQMLEDLTKDLTKDLSKCCPEIFSQRLDLLFLIFDQLVSIRIKQGKYPQAWKAQYASYKLAELRYGEVHPNTWGKKADLALLTSGQGSPETGIKLLLKVLSQRLHEQGPAIDAIKIDLMTKMGMLLDELGDLGEAEYYHRNAVLLSECKLGKAHPMTMTSMLAFANFLRNHKLYAEADRLRLRADAAMVVPQDASSEGQSTTIYNLADSMETLERYIRGILAKAKQRGQKLKSQKSVSLRDVKQVREKIKIQKAISLRDVEALVDTVTLGVLLFVTGSLVLKTQSQMFEVRHQNSTAGRKKRVPKLHSDDIVLICIVVFIFIITSKDFLDW